MNIRFINQAGIAIEQDGHCVMIDPWFIPSTVNNLKIQSLESQRWTVDFQLRSTKDTINSFKPDGILISLLHPHHSPLVDVYALISQSERNVQVAFPKISVCAQENIEKTIEAVKDKTQMRGIVPMESFSVGPFEITALPHTLEGNHLCWHIKSNQGSVLHLADAPINKNPMSREIDPIWDHMKDLRPSILFIGAGGRSMKKESSTGQKQIVENIIMSPVEAARLTAFINPKIVANFGTFSHSIIERQVEYTPLYSQIEDQFEWALNYLAPEVKSVALKPGYRFEVSGQNAALVLN